MDDIDIPVENLRIKIPKDKEEDKEEEEENKKKYNNNLLYFICTLLTNLFKIRIPRFFTINKIF